MSAYLHVSIPQEDFEIYQWVIAQAAEKGLPTSKFVMNALRNARFHSLAAEERAAEYARRYAKEMEAFEALAAQHEATAHKRYRE